MAGQPTFLAGRADEQRILETAIQRSAEGRPSAVFVRGEAGVGKTRLVRRACEDAARRGAVVLWAQCLHFGSVDSPYLPLVRALDGWVTAADPAEVADVLESVDGAAELLPSLGGSSNGHQRLLPVIEALVLAIAARHPALLVVDDVQWADLASRDALAYLIAGFRNQRLAVLTTHRDEELGAGHPMHNWLAELRRLPGVAEMRLARLSRDETEEQIAMIIGGRPQPRLVAEVVRRSDGNPYLSELLIRGLTTDDELLPPGLPVELADALLAAWHRLSAPARQTTSLLAVGGRPAAFSDLMAVAATLGLPDVHAAVAEATNQGILIAQGPDACWFRHPLLADVLSTTLAPGAAAPIHAAWAAALEGGSSVGIDEVRRQGDLALHHEAANNPAAALGASMRAAELAQKIRAPQEAAGHLRRAARLWPAVHHGKTADVAGEVRLMEDLARTSHLVGDVETSIDALSRALDLVDPEEDPLHACRLLLDWSDAAYQLDRVEGQPLAEARRAVRLSEPFPDRAEYANALSNLSSCEVWSGDHQASRRHAEAAIEAAQHSGDGTALSVAYGVLSLTTRRSDLKRSDDCLELAAQYAQASGDPEVIAWSAIMKHHQLRYHGDITKAAQVAEEGFQRALEADAIQGAVRLANMASRQLMALGRLSDSSSVIREGLALPGSGSASAGTRLDAALLATRRGELETAEMHLQRAADLIPTLETRAGMGAPPILAEYLLARQQPEPALDLLERTMTLQVTDQRVGDEMLMWSARAAADLAQGARDHHDREGVRKARTTLDRLIALHDSLPHPAFDVLDSEDLVQPAIEALYQAETGRCVGERPSSTPWEKASRLCEAAGLRWEQMIASWRWVQALLNEGARPSTVAATLRTVYRFAVLEEAVPLRRQALALAAIGRIPLEEPLAPSNDDVVPAPFTTLTKREREVLTHLVAGRTYAEIAGALFISEKTVSVHVSNLLRKTGTASRREVTALAMRLGEPTDR
ncbi:BREX system ATP-binding domain-containing protein [Kribbella sp. NPDC051620]|uniref:helix-turn-helix transcriptional regulator n=1 Tax=Kribbella sp. NPDC051620 TaxID=3364120 RepID=UPI0037A02D61